MKVVRSSSLHTAVFAPRNIVVLIFRGWVDPRAHGTVWCPGKNPQWLGIDPGTLRLVAQCLNHYAAPGLQYNCSNGAKARSLEIQISWIENVTNYYRICFKEFLCFLKMSTSLCPRVTAETHPENGWSLQWTEINGEFQKLQEIISLPVFFYFIQTNSCTFFETLSHSHLKH
jgi:hypothetical protein